mgnify:CR=1 FL=1
MKKHQVQQKTERRIGAGLRLALVAILLLAQIALVIGLSKLLQQRMAVAYTLLEILALFSAVRVYTRPGSSSYKIGWILLILAVPVAGLILYWLWNGGRQSKRLDLKKLPPPREPGYKQEESRLNVERLRQSMPQWVPLAAYLNNKGFPLYRNTAARYLPTGKAFLEDMLDAMEQAVTLLIEAQRGCEELYVTSCAREEELLCKNCHYDEKEGLTIGKKEIK